MLRILSIDFILRRLTWILTPTIPTHRSLRNRLHEGRHNVETSDLYGLLRHSQWTPARRGKLSFQDGNALQMILLLDHLFLNNTYTPRMCERSHQILLIIDSLPPLHDIPTFKLSATERTFPLFSSVFPNSSIFSSYNLLLYCAGRHHWKTLPWLIQYGDLILEDLQIFMCSHWKVCSFSCRSIKWICICSFVHGGTGVLPDLFKMTSSGLLTPVKSFRTPQSFHFLIENYGV